MKNSKFQFFKRKAGQFQFRLKATNGEIVVSSEGYTTLQNCKKGVEAIQVIAADAAVEELQK